MSESVRARFCAKNCACCNRNAASSEVEQLPEPLLREHRAELDRENSLCGRVRDAPLHAWLPPTLLCAPAILALLIIGAGQSSSGCEHDLSSWLLATAILLLPWIWLASILLLTEGPFDVFDQLKQTASGRWFLRLSALFYAFALAWSIVGAVWTFGASDSGDECPAVLERAAFGAAVGLLVLTLLPCVIYPCAVFFVLVVSWDKN